MKTKTNLDRWLQASIVVILTIIGLMVLFALSSCEQEIFIEPYEKDWGEHTEAVVTFETPPTGDKFCKTTHRLRMWFDGQESLLHIVETPVGSATAHGWYLKDVLVYDSRSSQIIEYKTECKTEAEWFNYWDQGWIYDNQWHDCSYYVPYPFP